MTQKFVCCEPAEVNETAHECSAAMCTKCFHQWAVVACAHLVASLSHSSLFPLDSRSTRYKWLNKHKLITCAPSRTIIANSTIISYYDDEL